MPRGKNDFSFWNTILVPQQQTIGSNPKVIIVIASYFNINDWYSRSFFDAYNIFALKEQDFTFEEHLVLRHQHMRPTWLPNKQKNWEHVCI
jgi:hypothetical protein